MMAQESEYWPTGLTGMRRQNHDTSWEGGEPCTPRGAETLFTTTYYTLFWYWEGIMSMTIRDRRHPFQVEGFVLYHWVMFPSLNFYFNTNDLQVSAAESHYYMKSARNQLTNRKVKHGMEFIAIHFSRIYASNISDGLGRWESRVKMMVAEKISFNAWARHSRYRRGNKPPY